MQDILRKEWGYEGIVVTDWGGCNDRIDGLKAGNELDMPGNTRGADAVFEALESGKISSDLVDDCLDRLIDLLLETDRSVRSHSRTFDADAHHALAEKCAEECIVLLKNSNDVLPLADEKVSFIGSFAGTPRFQGAGSSIVNPTRTINIIDEVHKYPLNFIGYAEGFERFGKKNDRLRTEAVELAGESDTIVFFAGLDEIREAEGIDRPDMKLPANQLELLKEILALKKKTVVALFSGSSVEMDVIEDADAIVHMYLSGQGSSSALLRVLCGQVNPSGKLAESYPFRYEDCSTAKLFHSGDFAIEYREGPFIGYRYYQTADVPVRYPFGFGLSYTTFAYSNLETDPCGDSFTITNTGSREGAETAQLYISKKDSTLIRPAKELKGFKKVFLKSGESAAVRIDFNDYTFRFFDTAAGCW